MLAPKRTKSRTGVNLSVRQNTNPASELKFITELGRSLLFTVHPKKVALRVAKAIRQEIGAEICAVIVELEHFGLVSCADTSNTNKISENSLNKIKMKAAKVRLHSKLPKTDVWTYEGTFPGPTLEVQSGEKVAVEWINEIDGKMPIVAIRSGDNTQNEAGRSGRDPISGIDQLPAWTVAHLHGGRNAADSDGCPFLVQPAGVIAMMEHSGHGGGHHH